jgi:hypothetical protein
MQKDKHMRNGKTLLLLAAVALISAACPTIDVAAGEAQVSEIEDYKDSRYRAIFPVSEKPNPAGVGMQPTAFNHFVHVKKAGNCMSCHHNGITVACTSCHTMEGKDEGGFVTLTAAMHKRHIAQRPEGTATPQSCISCHAQQTKSKPECAGCHSIVKPARSASSCAPCHNMTPSMTTEQMQQGSAGTLPDVEKLALASATIKAREPARYLTPEDGPYKVYIDGLSDKFGSNMYAHRRHVESVMEKLADNKLAQAFHANPETLCATCHHISPLSATPPKCGSCHKATIDPEQPGRTNLKAAYHLMCMNCHKGMQVARPVDTSCATCHKPRATQSLTMDSQSSGQGSITPQSVN